jgi:outer membrane protein, multidrug efflux system
MRGLNLIAAASLAVLASACTLAPAYQRPALPTPAAFPAATAEDTTGAPASSLGWRTFFTDPKLRSVIQLALTNNRDLRVAIANVEASRAQYRVQRADLLPHVGATGSATEGSEPSAVVLGVVTPGAPSRVDIHEYSVNVGVSAYELDLFGRVRSLTKAALEQYLATDEARRASQITIVSQVAADYLTLAADEAQLKAARDTLASSTSSLGITQKRFQFGIAGQLDVSQAQTLVAQARADVANETTVVAQDRNALDLVVGSPTPDTLLPTPLGDDSMVLSDLPAGLPSQVLLTRPDVLEAEHKLKSGNANIGAARAAFFPAISLTGSGGVTSLSLASLFSPASTAWSFAPQVTLPIFAGGANVANLDYAKAQRTILVATYEKTIQTAFSEVANTLARRATIGDQVAAQEANVKAAAETLTLSQARYDRGADTYLNVLIAQRTLYAAQQQLISARLIRQTNLVTLYSALGGGVG